MNKQNMKLDLLPFQFQRSTNLKALFIDTYFDESSPKENEKFQQYTKQLLDFANSVEPFECKDIKTALTELMEAQKNINDLKNDLENANNQLQEANDQLENSNVCLFWSFCFNPPQIGSFGTVMFFVGCIISILIVCCCQKWCMSSCPCCIAGKFI